jgi:tetratricopeptide (TPR) repeat protein
MRRIFYAAFLGLAALMTAPAEPSNYTYNYDMYGDYAASPDAYRVGAYLLGTDFGIGAFQDPQGLFIRENRVYLCDSGNNRIVLLLARDDGSFELGAAVSSALIDGEESPFNYPTDIFETPKGEIYVADRGNQRVLKLDRDWNCRGLILKPEDETIDAEADFLPVKLVADAAGRVYVLAANVNKGLMEFDNNLAFSAYMGANKAQFNPVDYLWKSISSKAQRATMELFIPTEYNNLCLDPYGFIYVTNYPTSEDIASFDDPQWLDPVRRLTSSGSDILVRNGYSDPVGDFRWDLGPSRFIDVTAMENDTYACFDKTRGRIFVYDFQGNILYAFGGLGNREGYFMMPVALDHMGLSLFALDSRLGALTRFDLTVFGETVNAALDAYRSGRYGDSAAAWEEALKRNSNYDLAYIGLGRAAFLEGNYKKAMDYFKVKRYVTGYGEAFQYYRKEWIERNIWIFLLIIGAAIVIPPAARFARRTVKELREP